MKTKLFPVLALTLLCAFNSQLTTAHAQGTTAFAYQGQLHDGGTNANGAYTLIFALYNSASGGNEIGSAITNSPTLANGLFTVNLDFGAGAFNGNACWLDITVQSGADSEELTPRVQVLPAPYALYSSAAGSLSSGTWNANVGNYQTYSNVFGIYANGSLVLGLTTNGVAVNGSLQANKLSIGNDTISSDGNGGLDVNNVNTNANLTINNLALNGNTIQFPAQAGATIAVDTSGDFTFDNNISISSLGVLGFPGPDSSVATIKGTEGGSLLISGPVQIGDTDAGNTLNVWGSIYCNSGEIYGTLNQSSDRNLKEECFVETI